MAIFLTAQSFKWRIQKKNTNRDAHDYFTIVFTPRTLSYSFDRIFLSSDLNVTSIFIILYGVIICLPEDVSLFCLFSNNTHSIERRTMTIRYILLVSLSV